MDVHTHIRTDDIHTYVRTYTHTHTPSVDYGAYSTNYHVWGSLTVSSRTRYCSVASLSLSESLPVSASCCGEVEVTAVGHMPNTLGHISRYR